MRKVAIRDNRSKEKVKPRVLDYIETDDGTEIIEIKFKNFELSGEINHRRYQLM